MIYITGDTHGSVSRFSRKNWSDGRDSCKIIITGDFGLVWDQSNEEKYWIKWLESKPWEVLFCDGNHENFTQLYSYPIIEKYGGLMGVVGKNIYHLRRGEIYIIEDKKFFVFGGAVSCDKYARTIGRDWWPEEVPNYKEMDYALNNLEKNDNVVDYIITHTCPLKLLYKIQKEIINDPTTKFLNHISNTIKFEKWFMGHMHINLSIGRYYFLYEGIVTT